MNSAAPKPRNDQWLLESGPKQLELLFRALVYQPAEPILVADNDRNYQDVSCGAGRLFGLPRHGIIGRKIDDFAEPSFRPQIEQLWRTFLRTGEQQGTFRLVGPGGEVREVEYTAKGNVLPVRHVLAMRDKSGKPPARDSGWIQDYAVYLFDPQGRIVAWYAGAERIYGYPGKQIVGQSVSVLYPGETTPGVKLQDELKKAAAQGHFGNERWHLRKDGSRFWANVVTLALHSEGGELQGYASVVRDFTKRRAVEEKSRRGGALLADRAADSTIAGVVSGEFDTITEANDAFLEMVGYSREDLLAGRLYWPDLTPTEYLPLDEAAHEEGMRYGACTPFEKEYVRKDGSRISVLVALVVLNLTPFRWMTIVQILQQAGGADLDANINFEEIVGKSTSLKRVLKQISIVAPTDATVLILGETGTGKELIARAIHRLSARQNYPFVTLNCAAIPTGLLESELFGYERGAFTGALAQKVGRFELANRGTLFLDEVGDIPLTLQPKLLRALQEKAYERLGGTRTIPIDVRLVAATNRDLAQMMHDKVFRSDLYYRLKVFPIVSPPLRDRPDDIAMLAEHFMRRYSQKMSKDVRVIPQDVLRALQSWSWPGNIRELENFIERSVILSNGNTLRAPLAELQAEALARHGTTLAEMEREFIIQTLRESDGVISTAANRLGIPRTTLNAMMRKLGISRRDF